MKPLLILLAFGSFSSFASDFPKVDEDLALYDRTVLEMTSKFKQTPSDPQDKAWVQSKLKFMFDVDQYMRSQWQIPFKHEYTKAEADYFNEQFGPRSESVDLADKSDLKELLKIYDWFRISTFGKVADGQAWIIVQHADLDPDFQKEVLKILEPLYPIGETSPENYAYLYDRVAASWNDTSKRILQRYGTQGSCTGPGTWAPIPMEDPDHVDERRASMGMFSMAEYLKLFKDICH